MAPPGILIPEAPPADLFTMRPDEIVRALFLDPAKAEAMLAAPLPPEAAAQAERDAASFARYASDPFLHNPELPDRLSRITAPTLVITPEVDVVIPPSTARPTPRRSTAPSCWCSPSAGTPCTSKSPTSSPTR